MSKQRVDPHILLILLLSVFAVAPLTAPGFFLNAHDATIGAYFLWQFDAGLRDGAWWPVWGADMVYGYGYPLFLVIAPLAYYVAEGFLLLGLGIVGALKATYALAMLLSGLAMYAFARRWLGRYGGLVAAVAYVYIPYHLVDIYVRADLAEFAALTFFPAVLWSVDTLMQASSRRQHLRGIAVLALSYGGLVLTHFTMGVIFTPVVAGYALWEAVFIGAESAGSPARPNRSMREVVGRLAAPVASLALGLALAAGFVLPALAELRFLQSNDLAGGYFSYTKHFVYFFQFFSPFWGYGYAGEGPVDQMPYQLGMVPVVLALVTLIALPGGLRRDDLEVTQRDELSRWAAFFLLLTGLFVFLMLGVSQSLWDLFRPVVAFIQFPWRLLVITGLSLAFLAGVLVAARRELAPILIVLLILASYTYTAPQYTDGDVSLKKMIEFELRTHELLGDTIWVKERPQTSPLVAQYLDGQPLTKAVALTEGATVQTLRAGGASVEARVTSSVDAQVGFYTRYFPGWRATVDGKELPLEPWGDQGLIRVQVPAGDHTVRLRYEDTPARTAGKAASLLTFLGVLWMLGAAREGRAGQG